MERFDLLLIMDDLNAERLKRLYGWTPGGKLRYLMDFAAGSRPRQEVADPLYTGDFEQSFKDITAACEGLLRLAG
jgi:protein-tyrosine phosphatase